MIILKATAEDSGDVFSWRNDPQTRAMFRSSAEVNWEDHDRWYRNALVDLKRCLFIGFKNDQKIGICRFDIDDRQLSAEVSLHLNPKMKGKGLSSSLLSLAIESFREQFNLRIVASIKKINESSIKCFNRSGFVLIDSDLEYNFYCFNEKHNET